MARTTDCSRLWFEEAMHWWMLLHGQGVTAADRRGFLSWVSRSPERIEAYLQVGRLMGALRSRTVRWPDTPAETLIREAKTSCETIETPVIAGLPSAQRRASAVPRPRRRRIRFGWRLSLGAAAAIAAALVVGWVLRPPPFRHYSTGAGEQRSILLADGSRITLNSASSVEVDLGKRRRIVRLTRGEALFQVSHDPARPFDVYARGEVVRAIGTEFNVDLHSVYTDVTVLQGRVAVMSAAQARLPFKPARFGHVGSGASERGPPLRQFPAPAGALILGVAQQVRITSRGVSAPRPVRNLGTTTAWTRGQLVFERRPLGEVVDELDRDGGGRIVIASAALRARKVTGVIQIDDPGSLLAFLGAVPGVEVHRHSDGTSVITLSRPRSAGAGHLSGAQRAMSKAHP